MIRLKGPRHSFHNPLDGLRVQPLNYVHNFNLTEKPKKKVTTPEKHVLIPPNGSMSCCKLSSSVLSWAVVEKPDVVAASGYASNGQSEKSDPRDSGRLFQHKSTSTSETRKQGRQFTLLRRITNSKV